MKTELELIDEDEENLYFKVPINIINLSIEIQYDLD